MSNVQDQEYGGPPAAGAPVATVTALKAIPASERGAKMATLTNRRLLLEAADTLVFDQITSTFTAGASSIRVACQVVKNVGA